jgi:hypothetical protein
MATAERAVIVAKVAHDLLPQLHRTHFVDVHARCLTAVSERTRPEQ